MAHRTTQRDINAAEKAALALSLRKQGYQLDEIAKQCGYQDKSGAWRAIKRELNKLPTPNAVELRKMEEMRLDDALKVVYPKVESGDLWAIDRFVALSKRRSEVTGMDATPDDLLAQQNYTKRIILTHSNGDQPSAAND